MSRIKLKAPKGDRLLRFAVWWHNWGGCLHCAIEVSKKERGAA